LLPQTTVAAFRAFGESDFATAALKEGHDGHTIHVMVGLVLPIDAFCGLGKKERGCLG
jgi:hypothetical protein